MDYFINLSVHNHIFWSENELNEAKKYGKIISEFPFEVLPDMEREDIIKGASDTLDYLLKKYKKKNDNLVVSLEANPIFSYYLIKLLKDNNIKVIYPYGKRLERDYNPSLDIRMTEKKFVFLKFIEY